MKELSIFIDESGDFGAYEPHSPFYIIAMVFHDQGTLIMDSIDRLDKELSYLGLEKLCIHTGPIIRREEIYASMDIRTRRRIFNKMIAFIRQINIRYKCFHIEKKHVSDAVETSGRLARQISQFIMEYYEEFHSFDAIKVYYDNGQVEVSKILSSVFCALLPNVAFRRVMPENYKLFQVADLVCSMELVKLKMKLHLISKSEQAFFGNMRDFRKNYIKPLEGMEWTP